MEKCTTSAVTAPAMAAARGALRRLRRYYWPYHRALAGLVRQVKRDPVRLGDLLVKAGNITDEQLEETLSWLRGDLSRKPTPIAVRPHRDDYGVALTFGVIHFSLMYYALRHTDAAVAAIVIQIQVPASAARAPRGSRPLSSSASARQRRHIPRLARA